MVSVVCPTCHRGRPATSVGGACPWCLLALALSDDDGPEPQADLDIARPDDPIPERLGPYRVLEFLGAGGMGRVWKARHESLDRVAALKVLRPFPGDEAAFLRRFRREARVLATLSHPNVIGVYETGFDAGVAWLAMEFVDGPTLRRAMSESRLTPERAIDVFAQVAEALEHAHARGVIHRDVKPDNILLDSRSGNIRLGDFGIAKFAEPDSSPNSFATASRIAVGTRSHMAPEQLESGRAVDRRTDVYALGVVLYEMLTGELPLGVFEPPGRKAPVNSRLDAAVMKALDKNPDRRWSSADEFRRAVIAARQPAGIGRRALLAAGVAASAALAIALPLRFRDDADEPGPAAPRADPSAGSDRVTLVGHTGRLWSAAYAPDGSSLATAAEDKMLIIRDADGNVRSTVRAFPRGELGPLCVAFSADSGRIATAGGDKSVRLWNALDASEVKTFEGHTREVTAVAFSPDGTTLASAGLDRTVRLWNLVGGGRPRVLDGHGDPVLCLAYSPTEDLLASGAMNGGIRLWRSGGDKPVMSLGHARRVAALAFSGDGKLLASASHDGTVILWRTGSDKPKFVLPAGSEAWAVALRPDGKLVASGHADGSVRFWNPVDGSPKGRREVFDVPVTGVSFSRDGKRLAICGLQPASVVIPVPTP